MSYRKYDPMIKKMIIESSNRNLFSEINIPRITINNWLKESKEPFISSEDYIYELSMKKLKEENVQLKAKNLLIKQCLEKLILELGGFERRSQENRKIIMETVESFKELLTLKEILQVIGISHSSCYR